MKDIIFTCPNCKNKFNFSKQLEQLVENDGTPKFSEKYGLEFNVIVCPNCESHWVLSISGVLSDDDYETFEIE